MIKKVTDIMRDRPSFSTAEGMDMIRPYYSMDYKKAYEQKLRRVVNRCARRVRDESGNRVVFALNDELINISLNDDPEVINAIKKQMGKQIDGFDKSRNRVSKQLQVLEGQISITDLMKTASQG